MKHGLPRIWDATVSAAARITGLGGTSGRQSHHLSPNPHCSSGPHVSRDLTWGLLGINAFYNRLLLKKEGVTRERTERRKDLIPLPPQTQGKAGPTPPNPVTVKTIPETESRWGWLCAQHPRGLNHAVTPCLPALCRVQGQLQTCARMRRPRPPASPGNPHNKPAGLSVQGSTKVRPKTRRAWHLPTQLETWTAGLPTFSSLHPASVPFAPSLPISFLGERCFPDDSTELSFPECRKSQDTPSFLLTFGSFIHTFHFPLIHLSPR